MGTEDGGWQVGGNESEKYIGKRMVVMCREGVWGSNGVEEGIMKLANAIWRGWVKNEAVNIVLQDLSSY